MASPRTIILQFFHGSSVTTPVAWRRSLRAKSSGWRSAFLASVLVGSTTALLFAQSPALVRLRRPNQTASPAAAIRFIPRSNSGAGRLG